MIGAIILAAGASNRIGTDKALLKYRGVPFLIQIRGIVESAGLRPVVVVLGPSAAKILEELDLSSSTIVRNPEPDTGPLQSLKLALVELNQTVDGALVWHVDRPRIQKRTVEQLAHRAQQGPEPIVVPSYGEKRGHPIVFMRPVFEELLNTPDALGARAVVRADPQRVAVLPVDDPAVLEDIDTAEDYRELS